MSAVGGQRLSEVAPQCIYLMVSAASLPYTSASVYTQNGSAAVSPFNVVSLFQHC